MDRYFMTRRKMGPDRIAVIRESSCCSGVCGKKCIKQNEVSSLRLQSTNWSIAKGSSISNRIPCITSKLAEWFRRRSGVSVAAREKYL